MDRWPAPVCAAWIGEPSTAGHRSQVHRCRAKRAGWQSDTPIWPRRGARRPPRARDDRRRSGRRHCEGLGCHRLAGSETARLSVCRRKAGSGGDPGSSVPNTAIRAVSSCPRSPRLRAALQKGLAWGLLTREIRVISAPDGPPWWAAFVFAEVPQRSSSAHVGDAGWSSPVARQAHNLKVVGSNPAPATTDSATPVSGVFSTRSAARLPTTRNSTGAGRSVGVTLM